MHAHSGKNGQALNGALQSFLMYIYIVFFYFFFIFLILYLLFMYCIYLYTVIMTNKLYHSSSPKYKYATSYLLPIVTPAVSPTVSDTVRRKLQKPLFYGVFTTQSHSRKRNIKKTVSVLQYCVLL